MTMIEQLLQQRITIHTPLFSIRTHLISTPADSEHDGYCERCKSDLPESAFGKTPSGTRGTVCRKCSTAKSSKRYQQRRNSK